MKSGGSTEERKGDADHRPKVDEACSSHNVNDKGGEDMRDTVSSLHTPQMPGKSTNTSLAKSKPEADSGTELPSNPSKINCPKVSSLNQDILI